MYMYVEWNTLYHISLFDNTNTNQHTLAGSHSSTFDYLIWTLACHWGIWYGVLIFSLHARVIIDIKTHWMCRPLARALSHSLRIDKLTNQRYIHHARAPALTLTKLLLCMCVFSPKIFCHLMHFAYIHIKTVWAAFYLSFMVRK